MKKGFLLSIEGGEGCGKSTQVKLLQSELKNKKANFICVREPGGTESGEQIRNILLHSECNLSSTSEFLLFSASRSILLDEVVLPALEDGKFVIMDRFYDSSFVYQGYAGTLPIKEIEQITKIATKGLTPDLTIYLDIDPKVAFERKKMNEELKNLDRIESKEMSYHQKVRQGYLTLAKNEPQRIYTIDATLPQEKIHEQIMAEIGRRLQIKTKS